MKKAYIVISKSEKKLVHADQVKHSDYSKIFQCPRCHATLTLREGHFRNKHWIEPTFVHPEGDLSECDQRVSFSINSSSQTIINCIERGQNSKRLEKAFIKCSYYFRCNDSISILEKYPPSTRLWQQSKELHIKRQIAYNEEPHRVYPDPNLLNKAACCVLQNYQFQQYIEHEIDLFRDWLLANEKAKNYFTQRSKHKNNLVSVESAINNHCRLLKSITKYIRKGSSKELQVQFFKITIWGSRKLPVPIKYLWTQREIEYAEQIQKVIGIDLQDNTYEIEKQREPQIQIIQEFNTSMLEQLCKEPKFLYDSFSKLNQSNNLVAKKFIIFILTTTLEAIKLYDWFDLPDFY